MRYNITAGRTLLKRNAAKALGRKNVLARELSKALKGSSFSSGQEYMNIMKKLTAVARKNGGNEPAPLYKKEIIPIKGRLALTEGTPWGGVSLKKVDVERNFIKKLLVVGKLGKLGFEYHRKKHERLEVVEGKCLVLYSNHANGMGKGEMDCKIAAKGDRFYFMPYDEHGILALTDCVIEEKSTNNLDDLVFIYNANARDNNGSQEPCKERAS